MRYNIMGYGTMKWDVLVGWRSELVVLDEMRWVG
jgi:hypothetical protein